jgi:hypothetical protein
VSQMYPIWWRTHSAHRHIAFADFSLVAMKSICILGRNAVQSGRISRTFCFKEYTACVFSFVSCLLRLSKYGHFLRNVNEQGISSETSMCYITSRTVMLLILELFWLIDRLYCVEWLIMNRKRYGRWSWPTLGHSRSICVEGLRMTTEHRSVFELATSGMEIRSVTAAVTRWCLLR